MELFGDIVGNIGVVCFLVAYWLLQKGKVAYAGGMYLGLNLSGSILLLTSLSIDWNMPAFVLEAAWALISMYGIYKHIILGRRK